PARPAAAPRAKGLRGRHAAARESRPGTPAGRRASLRSLRQARRPAGEPRAHRSWRDPLTERPEAVPMTKRDVFHVTLEGLADLLGDPHRGGVLEGDQRDEPGQPELAEGPVAAGSGGLRRVATAPVLTAELPPELGLDVSVQSHSFPVRPVA